MALADAAWPKSSQLLRRILMTMLAEIGKDVRPFGDGPTVRACDLEIVRGEFDKQHFADGTPRQKADARRKAFQRAVNAARDQRLIELREINGAVLVWLVRPESNKP